MEVHHHAHHEGKKNWKSYFWEFLMLFLAVFCGFLAEYQLEQTIERHREREYMQSMMEDLRLDTLEINEKLAQIDTMLLPVFVASTELLYSKDYSDSTVRKMYEFVPRASRFLSVSFEDRTTEQLKKSGSLRLIRNKQVTDSLAVYWKKCKIVSDLILPGYAEYRSKAKEIAYGLFNMNYYENNTPFSGLKKDVVPKVLTTDTIQFIKLANCISNLQSQSTGALTTSLNDAKIKATQLIELIKREYSFE